MQRRGSELKELKLKVPTTEEILDDLKIHVTQPYICDMTELHNPIVLVLCIGAATFNIDHSFPYGLDL